MPLGDVPPTGRAERGHALVGSRDVGATSILVSVALLLTGVLSAVQAFLLVVIVGAGETTDAFLAAYSFYTPVALLGISMRRSLVPLLGVVNDDDAFRTRATEVIGRVALLALIAVGLLLLLSPAIYQLLFRGFSDDGQRIALIAVIVLAPAAYLQLHAGSMSAVLNGVRRFPVSMGLYVGASFLALASSVLFLTLFGVLGAALGVTLGGVVLALGHAAYLRSLGIRTRPHAGFLTQRATLLLASYLLSGAAFVLAQQLSLPIALAAISATDPPAGTITSYVYAYFLVGPILNISSTSLALVTLPSLIEDVATRGRDGAEAHLLSVVPFVAAVLVPLIVALVTFGDAILTVLFGAVLTAGQLSQLQEITPVLALRAFPTGLYLLCTALFFALGKWRSALPIAGVSVILYTMGAYAFAPQGPVAVAASHAAASGAAMLLLLVAIFGRKTLSVLRRVLWRTAPTVLLAASFPLAALAVSGSRDALADLAALAVGGLAYVALAVAFWPSVSRPFIRTMRRRSSTSS